MISIRLNILKAVISFNFNLRAPLTISVNGELDLCLMINQFHKMLDVTHGFCRSTGFQHYKQIRAASVLFFEVVD